MAFRPGAGNGIAVTVRWNYPAVVQLVGTIPAAAHEFAAKGAARAAAQASLPSDTGALFNDLLEPKRSSPLSSEIGSSLPYAAIENDGGVIQARGQYMAVGARTAGWPRGSGQIYRMGAVPHPAKNYLSFASAAYNSLLMDRLTTLYAAGVGISMFTRGGTIVAQFRGGFGHFVGAGSIPKGIL